jgi:hypothetical protein
VQAQTALLVTINRAGKLIDIRLWYPTHLPELRQMEQMLTQQAHTLGLFPPLPDCLKGSQKTFKFPLFVHGQKGYHSYNLQYNP